MGGLENVIYEFAYRPYETRLVDYNSLFKNMQRSKYVL